MKENYYKNATYKLLKAKWGSRLYISTEYRDYLFWELEYLDE